MDSRIKTGAIANRSRIHQLWEDNRHPKLRERMTGSVVMPVLTGQIDKLSHYALKLKAEIKKNFAEMIRRTNFFVELFSSANQELSNVCLNYGSDSIGEAVKAFNIGKNYDSDLLVRMEKLRIAAENNYENDFYYYLQAISSFPKDKAIYLLEKTQEYSQLLIMESSKWYILRGIALGYSLFGEQDKAISILNDTAGLIRNNGSITTTQKISCLISVGICFYLMNERTMAVNMIEEAYQLTKGLPSSLETGDNTRLNLMGCLMRAYNQVRERQRAAEIQALEIDPLPLADVKQRIIDSAGTEYSSFFLKYYKKDYNSTWLRGLIYRELKRDVRKWTAIERYITKGDYSEAFRLTGSFSSALFRSAAMLKIAAAIFEVDPQVGSRERIELAKGYASRVENNITEKEEKFIAQEQARSGRAREAVLAWQAARSDLAKKKEWLDKITEYDAELNKIEIAESELMYYEKERIQAIIYLFENFRNEYSIRGTIRRGLCRDRGVLPGWDFSAILLADSEKLCKAEKIDSKYLSRMDRALILAAISLAYLKAGDTDKALGFLKRSVRYAMKEGKWEKSMIDPIFIAVRNLKSFIQDQAHEAEAAFKLEDAKRTIGSKMKQNEPRQEIVKLLFDDPEIDNIFKILAGLAPETAASLLKRILNLKPELIKSDRAKIDALIEKSNLAIRPAFLEGIREKLKIKEWEEMVQKIIEDPRPDPENKPLNIFLDQEKNDPRLKESLRRALEHADPAVSDRQLELYDEEAEEAIGARDDVRKIKLMILRRLAEMDRECADKSMLGLMKAEPHYVIAAREIAKKYSLAQCDQYYLELKSKFLSDLLTEDQAARRKLWLEGWRSSFRDDLTPSELQAMAVFILSREKERYGKIAGEILAGKEKLAGPEVKDPSEKLLMWSRDGYPGIENAPVDWELADRMISAPEEALLKLARRSAELAGEEMKEYDWFSKKLDSAQKKAAKYNLSLPMAYYLITAVREGYPRDVRQAFKVVNKVLASLPRHEKLDDIHAKYPAIPLDALCLCMAFKNNSFYMDRLLSIFNEVFSAKKIKDSINKKLAIKKALLNIYLNGDENNQKAVSDLLLLVEKDFGKSQHNSFVESLQHIETVSAFSDLVKMVEEKTGQAGQGEDEE